ncbi:hypothetical protein HZH66_001862 [Vespula vulgaris]|uniref:Uncharacterized protein n=1 Tax=Vespula vulgaris TaxID=7454 RepID=A0A834NEP2_VESVU|nr:hypothetical protein HZH66_001862 [Vespula vulgaris]
MHPRQRLKVSLQLNPLIVSRIYKDRSIGNPVSIFVTKITHADIVFGKGYDENYEITAIDMLNQFCRWQKINNPDKPSPEHHDVALLLTSKTQQGVGSLEERKREEEEEEEEKGGEGEGEGEKEGEGGGGGEDGGR